MCVRDLAGGRWLVAGAGIRGGLVTGGRWPVGGLRCPASKQKGTLKLPSSIHGASLRLLLFRCLLVSWRWLWLRMGQRLTVLLCLRLVVLCMAL